MKSSRSAPGDIDAYIAGFPADVQKMLQQVRRTIRKAAPDAKETISYRIPTFTLQGNLIHFAAFTNHIGIYPAPRGAAAFKDELSAYEGGKGTVRFPLDEPLPLDLITRIVRFRVQQLSERTRTKQKKR